MTLLFVDGFETYGLGTSMLTDNSDAWSTDNDVTSSGQVLVASSDRVVDGQCLSIVHFGSSAESITTRTMYLPIYGLSSSTDEWIFGAAIRAPDGFASATHYHHLFAFGASFVGELCTLRLRPNGDLRLDRVNIPSPTVNLDTAVGAVADATVWNYIEAKIKFHQTLGTWDIRLNGATVMSGTGNTSISGGMKPGVVLFGHIQGLPLQYDDFYIADTNGSLNNDFINSGTEVGGALRVQRVRPNAVGDDNDLAPSSAVDHYTLVNEDEEDDDTSYVESRTANDKDLYHYEDLDEAAAIHAVIAKPVLRKADGGSRTYQLLAKSGATEGNSGTRYPSASYIRQAYIWETDPDTGSAWTVSAFNAAQFGLQIVA